MKFPLTDFIVAMQRATNEQLSRANPEKMANKYGCRPQDVRGYLKQEMTMRGMIYARDEKDDRA